MEDSGIDSDPKPSAGRNATFEDNGSDSSASSYIAGEEPAAIHMQKKLERRLQEGKKLRRGNQGDYKMLNTVPNLIPIQRLPIPSKLTPCKEQLPLVEWDSDESEEDIHFFPVNKPNIKTELTDNFSLEEFDVSPDEDDLNLLPPKQTYRRIFCCSLPSKCSII